MQIIHLDSHYHQQMQDEYVVAIGNFDGIHKAHESVLRMARKLAKDQKMKFGVVTFDVTPKKIVNNIDNYFVLRTQTQKFEILEQLGVETVFLIKFDNDLRNVSASDFVQRFIINNNIKYVVCGFDYTFGKDKEGNVDFLLKYDQFKTIIISQEKIDDRKIGSTYIHELIMNGELEKANDMLVRPYSISGSVVHGNKKGRLIGFPTANLSANANFRTPASGVYAVKVIIDGKEYLGMCNVGHNPTFNYNHNMRIETNIFDFNGDLYYKEIDVVFYKFMRKEKIFETIDLLVKQLEKDKEEVIAYFEQLDHKAYCHE